MPRIPVRTEPYTSSTRQHRHFKSKRDLILRTLGKSSYINGSQFVIAWISAKGEVETYASEMLQDAVDSILDLELLKGLATQVRDGADRKREQLEEIQRKRREDGGLLDEQGRVLDEWADMEPAEMASHLLRSAKKAKAEKVAAEKAARIGASSSTPAKGKGKQPIRPLLTPLRRLQADVEGEETLVPDEEEDEEEGDEDDGEDEGEEEYEEDAEEGAQHVPMENPSTATKVPDFALDSNMDTVNLSLAQAHDRATQQEQQNSEAECGDVTLVDSSFQTLLATPSGESLSAMKRNSKLDDQQGNVTAPPSVVANVRQVQVTMTGSPLSIRNSSKASGTSKRATVMTSTPSRPTSIFPMSHAFVTPSTTHAGAPTRIIAPTPKSGKTSGLMNNVLEGSSGPSKPTTAAMLGPLLTLDKPHIPRPLAHVRTPSHANIHSTSLSGTPNTPSVQTRSITVPYADLVDWYADRFDALQQATCKLVVKTWIKVIEPKKQSKFPYNRGEESKPGWWPAHIRHKEPDHLQKPERAQILVAIIRSSVVPVSKLELSTAEATAYISQPKMKILREVYKVAKEDERKRNMGDEASDIVVNVPASPVSAGVSIPRPSILEEMEMQMMDDVPGQRSRRPSNATIISEKEYQSARDLASPCVIVPSASATFSASRHHKGGSIGESVFLGAGAMKKRKLDDLTQSNKENVNPIHAGSSKAVKARKISRTPLTDSASALRNSVIRPQSTGGIRKGKQQTTRQGQRDSAAGMNDLMHAPFSLPLSGVGTPLVHPSNPRPWSANGARSLVGGDGVAWLTSDTPMNQRQQRLQQVQGENIVRPMSSDSALACSPQFGLNGMYSTNSVGQSNFASPAGHYPVPGGMLHHSGSANAQGNLDMYLAADANGHVQMLPANMIPMPPTARGSFALHQNSNQSSHGLQYVPYGVQPQGMPPFSSVPHQGTFMVYESNPQFMRTNSVTSSGSSGGESRPQSQRQGTGHQSQQLQQQPLQRSSQNHLSEGGAQGYMYPSMQYPSLGYQPMYVSADPNESSNMHLSHHHAHGFATESGQMLPYAPGMGGQVSDGNIASVNGSTGHTRKSGKSAQSAAEGVTASKRGNTGPSVETSSNAATGMEMTMNLPLSTANHADMPSAMGGFEQTTGGMSSLVGNEDGMTTPTSTTTTAISQRQLHVKLLDRTNHVGGVGDGTRMQTISSASAVNATATSTGTGTGGPTVMEPTQPPEMSEMETVEREFVKFSDGSDRENFWTHEAL